MKCRECMFWSEVDPGEQDEIPLDERNGECRRYPPKLDVANIEDFKSDGLLSFVDSSFWCFPVTEGRNWCGEFRSNERAPTNVHGSQSARGVHE